MEWPCCPSWSCKTCLFIHFHQIWVADCFLQSCASKARLNLTRSRLAQCTWKAVLSTRCASHSWIASFLFLKPPTTQNTRFSWAISTSVLTPLKKGSTFLSIQSSGTHGPACIRTGRVSPCLACQESIGCSISLTPSFLWQCK